MLYPANGATGVPDGNFNLVLATAYASATVEVTAAGAAPIALGSPAPDTSPLPSPAATPVPGETPNAYAVPALKAATTYTVTGVFAQDVVCPIGTQTVGTFTTQ